MIVVDPDGADFSDAHVPEVDGARWRSAAGHSPSTGASASGSSLIQVPAGCRLPRHTDSAEETVVVVEGVADLSVGDERGEVRAGGLAVIPRDVPHEVRNAGDGTLSFVAVYAAPDVVTRYEHPVRPDGSRERHTVS